LTNNLKNLLDKWPKNENNSIQNYLKTIVPIKLLNLVCLERGGPEEPKQLALPPKMRLNQIDSTRIVFFFFFFEYSFQLEFEKSKFKFIRIVTFVGNYSWELTYNIHFPIHEYSNVNIHEYFGRFVSNLTIFLSLNI
jgi:hypothetical protein